MYFFSIMHIFSIMLDSFHWLEELHYDAINILFSF